MNQPTINKAAMRMRYFVCSFIFSMIAMVKKE